MLILNEDQIKKSVTILDVLSAVEKSFMVQETNDFHMPDRMHVEKDENMLLIMPAFAGDLFSTKLVSLFPGNRKENIPLIQASVLLNDGKTGKLIALMDGAVITGLRTGAVGGLAAAYTTPKGITRMGLIGAGYQGFHQVLFVAAVRNIEEVYLYDPFLAEPEEFVERLKSLLPHIHFHIAGNLNDVLTNADVIVTATNTDEPVVPNDKDLLRSKHFIGVGSYKPNMREYPDELFGLLDNVIVDTDLACRESGDLAIPIEKKLVQKSNIFRLGQVINGDVKIDTSKTTFFKTVGMGLFDLFTAKLIYEKASAKGLGTQVEF